jgi:hypothetical protein
LVVAPTESVAVIVSRYVPAGRVAATVSRPTLADGLLTVNADGNAELIPVKVLFPVPCVAVKVSYAIRPKVVVRVSGIDAEIRTGGLMRNVRG